MEAPIPAQPIASTRRALSGRAAFFLGLVIGLILLLGSGRAAAQSQKFYLDRAQLSGAPDDGFIVWRPKMYDESRFYGMAALGYAHNPLRDTTVTGNPSVVNRIDNPVQGQFITYLMAGTQLAKRLSLNLSVPILLYQITGDDPAGQGVGDGGLGDSKAALHDTRLDVRFLIHESERKKTRLGVSGAVFIPTGNSTVLASDGATSTLFFANFEHDFDALLLAAHLGPHLRPNRSIGGTQGSLFLASELRWAVGAYMPLKSGRIRLGAELWGQTGIQNTGPSDTNTFFSTRNTHIEWLAQARFLMGKAPAERLYWMVGGGTRLAAGYGAADFRILASIGTYFTLKDVEPDSPARKFVIVPDGDDYEKDTDGDGYPDNIDKCPTVKEDGKKPNPTDGCPVGSDRDNDGIPDLEDDCPDDPEDKDGVQDEDGCPEKDADEDGILDVEDKCPTEYGTKERNGCPGKIKFDEGGVTLLEPIQFETGRANIKPVSFPILNEVVGVMKQRPKIRLGVYGHTDSVGGADMNLRLSKARAAAVMRYLATAGIDASRLESEGYGLTQPLDTNDTPEGRAKNRRVEFKILE